MLKGLVPSTLGSTVTVVIDVPIERLRTRKDDGMLSGNIADVLAQNLFGHLAGLTVKSGALLLVRCTTRHRALTFRSWARGFAKNARGTTKLEERGGAEPEWLLKREAHMRTHVK